MRYSLLILSILFIVVSCKKVEVPKSKQDILRASSWRLDTANVTYWVEPTGGETKGHDTTVCAWGAVREGCKMDDYIVFRENNDAGLKKGEVKCGNGETEEETLMWGITDGDSKIYIYNAGDMFFDEDAVNATINELTGDKLTFTYQTKVPFAQPVVGVITKTYKVYLKKK